MDINFWAILLCAVASMVIGSVWYGPLFGKKFREACGMDKWTPERQQAEMKKMGLTYFIQLIASLVMFFVLAMFIGDLNKLDLMGGIEVALWSWIGFVVPTQLGSAIWGGNMTLFWLGAGNMLLTLVAAGAIIGALA